jgi:hypothetical protein
MKKERRESLPDTAQVNLSTELPSGQWIKRELERCEFRDVRHGKRLRKLLEQLSEQIGGTIPWACQDWANTKAAYRFFSNGRVSEEEILAGTSKPRANGWRPARCSS